MSPSIRRMVVALCAALLVGLTMVAGVQPAQAQTTIDPAATGSLTIHKYLGATTGQTNDGSAITTTPEMAARALSGVVFDLYRVNGIDLTTNQGWLDAAALQKHTITATEIANKAIVVNGTTYTLSTPTSLATVNGVLTYPNLPVGLYLVNENLGASGTLSTPTNPNVPKGSITPSAPFLVTLPISYNNTTTPPTDKWVYDINVYPKNTQDSITKQVLDGNVGTAGQDAPKVGTDLTYRLQSTIVPAIDYNADGSINGADIAKYVVGDGLSPYVTYKSATLSIVNGAGTVVANGTLTAGTDYTVAAPAAGTAGGPVVYTFTAAGLDKLMAAKVLDATVQVRTDIVATVTSLPADGLVPNKAYFIPSQAWYDSATNPDNGIPSNEVVSKYGDLRILKTNEPGTLNLAGAIFEVYRAPAYNSCANLTLGTPLMTSAATNAAGLTEFSGLQLSNWYNDGTTSGAITDPTQFHNYCLVEIKAPDGYQLLAQPVLVSLTTAGVTAGDVTQGQTPTQIKNMPDNLNNNLPLTGGQGVAAIGIAGLLLVGGGVGYNVITRRKENDA